MVDHALTNDPKVLELLQRHHRVKLADLGSRSLEWRQGDWSREVRTGDYSVELRGLVELMDNNPLVCADVVSVPSAGATLGLIALGPLAAAGLIQEPPVLMSSAHVDEEELSVLMGDLGWSAGLFTQVVEMELNGAVAATAMVVIQTPDDLAEIDELFEERFGRSFFVRREEEAEWDVRLVLGTNRAVYRLRITPDEPNSLLTVQVMAELAGKCGAAQLVHAMNVMCGFEESLGLV